MEIKLHPNAHFGILVQFTIVTIWYFFYYLQNDWGGAIQIVEDEFYCMWQIFGVYIRGGAGPTNCSQVRHPSLFKLLNEPGVLAWIEEIIFPDFIITDICLEEPKCISKNTDLQRRCIKPT